jgi:hypothetical protein
MSDPHTPHEHDLIAALNDLIQLDHEAIDGYTIAINTIRNQGHREALVAFRHDHARHVEALSALVRAHGGVPARLSHLGGPLGPAVKALGGASANDTAVLLAFRDVERQSRDRYRRQANAAYPEDVRPVLVRHASDEEIHYRWIESSLDDMGIERADSLMQLPPISQWTRGASFRADSVPDEPRA